MMTISRPGLALSRILPAVLLTFAVSTASFARESPRAVPTFECLGIYYTSGSDQGECPVSFRRAGSGDWKMAQPLWYDARDTQYRGSIVGLEPGTDYEIRLRPERGSEQVFKAATMSEEIPVGGITYLDGGVTDEVLHITEGGSAEGWRLFTPEPGRRTVFDPERTTDHNIVIEADYVIIRGLELRSAVKDAILIGEGVQHVLIEDCHITLWGRGDRRMAWLGWGDSAIRAGEGAGNLIIQRNLIAHPVGWSNDWDTGHPSGPQAVTLRNTSGNNIIRYNEIVSTEDHGYNDAIGGGSNYSFEGSPNRDSDIYGNIISNVWDDAIESEGANMNVRIWGNYIHHTFTHIATASTTYGPLYIFRNVFGLARRTQKDPSGGPMIKMGEREPYKGGRRYVFHNTALQPRGAFSVFSTHPPSNTISRNNIFDCRGPLTYNRPGDPPADFDYDLFTGLTMRRGFERNGINARVSFMPSTRLEWYLSPTTTRVKWGRTEVEHHGESWTQTDKVIEVPNPAIDAGVLLPNFNDDFGGDGPDIGAFERGRPPIIFGRQGLRPGELAPWEIYAD